VSSADDEMSPSDRILMQSLAQAVGTTEPPTDLIARCEGLLTWLDVESELAVLLDQPVAEAAGTRGAASSATTHEFAIDDGSCVIELDVSSEHLRGQVLGATAQQIVIRTAPGTTHIVPVDETGHFSLEDPPSGPIRLELEPSSESRRIHTDWFVV
jgi:hypothetical protein